MLNKIDLILPLSIFIITFTVYINFLVPSILQGDPAEFCIASYVLGIPHPNGYPIYTWIGHLFTLLPIESVAYRVNLMSAFFGAVSVSLIYLIVLKIILWNKNFNKNSLNGSNQNSLNIYRFIAIIAAFSLAFSRTFWSQSEFAEVYTLNAFFIALMILILLMWSGNENNKYLYAFFLIYGVSIGTHSSNLLFMPVFLLYIYLINYKVFLNVENASLFLIFFLLGLSQFLYILIRATQIPEYSYISPGFNEWWYLITAKQYAPHLIFSIPDIPQRILIYLDHFKANYLVLGSIFGIIGIVELFRKNKKILLLLGLMFIFNVSFYLNYYIYDVEMMFIPSFLIFSIFIGTGIFAVLEFIKDESENFKENITFKDMKFDIFSISIILILLISSLMPVSFYSTNNDNIKQIKDDKIVDFTFAALKGIPSNSTIITYWHPCTAFKYYQIVENVNPNVKIIAVDDQNLLNTINQNINNGKVFIVYDISLIEPYYKVTPFLGFSDSEILYKIEKY